jgi:hypothetical protein
MTQEIWKWYVGSCEEEFHTTCDSREEAVETALGYGGAWIIEATKGAPLKLSAYFDTDRFLEDAEDRADDLKGPDCEALFYVTFDQGNDLEAMVRAAIDAWQERHGLKFVPWVFVQTRNLQWIDKPQEPSE